MTAFYNEIDPQAAAWLRELIAGGHVAPGTVDTRDIRDIRPEELTEYDQCHFFAGIAGWPDDRPVWTGSCPCQPFSAAGKRGGTSDERHLWPTFHWLTDKCRPPMVFGEQVASKDGLGWLDLVCADLEGSGYAVGAADLCAASVGAPHIRQRLWWCGVRLADAGLDGSQGWVSGRPDAEREALDGSSRRGGATGRLADADGRQSGHGHVQPGGQHGLQPEDRGAGRLASHGYAGPWKSYADWFGVCWHHECRDSDRGFCDCNTRGAPDGWEWDADEGWLDRRMADAAHVGRGKECSDAGGGPFRDRPEGRPSGLGASGGDCRPGAAHGGWSDADWLRCRDGRWRPVEPGTFPLAHGIPARVGRLRGYGNAIVPQVAAEFIKAFDAARRGRLFLMAADAEDVFS